MSTLPNRWRRYQAWDERPLRLDKFAIEDAPQRQLCLQWTEQLREITIEWLFVSALEKDLIAIAEYQDTKTIPLGLEDPVAALW